MVAQIHNDKFDFMYLLLCNFLRNYMMAGNFKYLTYYVT